MIKKTKYRIEGTCGAKVVINGKEYELAEDIHGEQWEGFVYLSTEASAQTTTGAEVFWMLDGEALDQWAEEENWNTNILGVIELEDD